MSKKRDHSQSASAEALQAGLPVFGSTENPNTSTHPDLWQVAFRAKWLLAIGLGVGLFFGYLAFLKFGPTFDASARIIIEKKIPKQLHEDERDASAIGDRAEHIHIIMSPKVIGPAVAKHHLDKLKTLAGEDEPDREILDALRVKRIGGQEKSTLNVFELTFNWGNEGDARKILSAVIDSYNDYLVSTRTRYGQASVESIRQAADRLLGELKTTEKAYEAFRQKAPLIWKTPAGAGGQPGDTTNVYQQRVLEYEGERRKNRAEITSVQSKISALEEAIQRGEPRDKLEILARKLMQLDGGAALSAAGIDGNQTASLQAALLPLLLEESKLVRAGFGPRYQGLVAVRENIRQVKDFYRRQGIILPEEQAAKGNDGQPKIVPPTDPIEVLRVSLRYELQQMQNRDKELTALFEEADREAKKFDHVLSQDKQFNDDIRRKQAMYDEEVNRLDKARLIEDDQGYIMEEITPVHTEKSMKRPIQCLGMGGALGFAIAFGLAYFFAITDQRLNSPEDVRNRFGLSVLGQVPTFTGPGLQAAAKARPDLDPTLFYLTRPGSHEAEAYRSVRTALFFRCRKLGHKIIQITSPEPQDGKTTVAANLALAMAHAGQKVLLIDADLRCPKVDKILRLRHDVGLSDVIAGEIQGENAIQTCEIAGLSVITAGLTPANPAEMLGSVEFEQLLQQLRDEYDYIIVDTPPLMAVSDPCIVASRADVLLLVVRIGKNKLTTIRNSCELLSALGVPIMGAVVNDVTLGDGRNYGQAYHDASQATASASPQVSAPVLVSAPMTPGHNRV